MASRIRILPPALADQIAAGEVIERPASVVKELVENAIDAGAGKVIVEVEAGGRRLVRVTDDGCGMTREDARLAFQRHATSKLASAEDLFRLETLGFRGEALPSIAAVSRLTLTTRTRDEIAGTRVEVMASEEKEVRDAGCPAGTQVEVRDLLYNVPARLKFLKSDAGEAAAVTETVLRLALAHTEVSFVLRQGGRTGLDLPAHAEERERVQAALGRRDRTRFQLAEGEEAGVCVRAYLGKPEESQPSGRGVYLFVNRRFVRDRSLLHALVAGYGELLERGRYPEAAVFVEVPAGAVDVNVHPQKLEVRFVRASEVQGALRHAVKACVAGAPWLRAPVPAAGASAVRPSVGAGGMTSAMSAPPQAVPAMREAVQQYLAATPSMRGNAEALRPAPPPLVAHGPSAASAPVIERERDPETVPVCEPHASTASGTGDYFSALEYIGQLHRLYLVCQTAGELVLVDQHAAHERVAFERLRSHGANAARGQRLLFPVIVEPGADLVAVAEESAEMLASMGLEVEPFGARSLAVKAIPEALAGSDPGPLVQDVLAELAETGAPAAIAHRLDHLFATMACHSVTRAGDALTAEEARALLASMDGVDRRANCPHGRPVVLRMRMDDLARRFERM